MPRDPSFSLVNSSNLSDGADAGQPGGLSDSSGLRSSASHARMFRRKDSYFDSTSPPCKGSKTRETDTPSSLQSSAVNARSAAGKKLASSIAKWASLRVNEARPADECIARQLGVSNTARTAWRRFADCRPAPHGPGPDRRRHGPRSDRARSVEPRADPPWDGDTDRGSPRIVERAAMMPKSGCPPVSNIPICRSSSRAPWRYSCAPAAVHPRVEA